MTRPFGRIEGDGRTLAGEWSSSKAEFGLPAAAKQDAAAALSLAPGRDIKVIAALTFARAGDTARAKSLMEELQKSDPLNTVLKLYWMPIIQAAIALSQNPPDGALQDLQAVSPSNWAPRHRLTGNALYPAYLHSESICKCARQGAQAAAEFQKLLDHRGIVLNFPLGALAHLELGRA